MRFEFATANRIIFGTGALSEIGAIAADAGRHAFVVTGRNAERSQGLLAKLSEANVATTVFSVAGEPTTDDIANGSARARSAGCDFVIGFGGGSALDAAKAISALIKNDGELLDFLEVIGRGKPMTQPAAPCIAIPTTAGTGSEVTRNAVLSSPSHHLKVSLRSPHMLPRVALVDPELTYGLPFAITASTGLDALTQLIEPYVSARANPLTDGLCIAGIKQVARSLVRASSRAEDPTARSDMASASLLGGLALANAGLGAVHGFAAPIGGMFPAPHGAICATLLPHVMRTNLQALRSRAPAHPSVERYTEIGRLLTGATDATAEDAIAWVEKLVASLQIPSLRAYGITATDTARIVAAAANASSMKSNPIALTSSELTHVLVEALG